MGKIHELPKSSSRLLTSSQIITSVYCVVKELIENALDSSSINVEVKLEDYGLEKIEVKDNGCGIDKKDIQFVAKPHFTSKITSYSDLNKIETYGFRGEALGAICAVADLAITTKSFEENIGCIASFGHDGEIMSSKPCPCAQGTTVTVLNLFKNIPVRRQYYRSDKSKKDDLRKVEDLLISYGCIRNDVRFALYHNKNLIWQKPALSSTKDSLIHILGNSMVDNLKYAEHIDEQNQRKIEAYLPKLESSLTCGLSTSSRCITVINKRPVRIKTIDKLLKEYYNKAIQNCGKARYPICYVSFTTLLTEVDVNVEPNKTTVMLHNSEEILEQFSEMLKIFYCTDANDDNVNILQPDNAIPAQDPKSNASEFLNSLKVNSDAKFQQSKLTNGGFASLKNNSVKENSLNNSLCNSGTLTKKDIIEVGNLKEPRKKKLKTSTQSSKKDIENHINTLHDFFGDEEQTGMNKTPNISSNFMHNVPIVTVERVCSNPDRVSPMATSKVGNGIDSGRITTFAVSSNVFSNNIPQDISNVSSNVKHNLSDSSLPSLQLKDDFVENNVNSRNEQNGETWSHGVHPSGELIQPVTVLQPKNITASKYSLKRANDDNSSEEVLPDIILENSHKRPEMDHSTTKESLEKRIVLLKEKLTAFDMFCRNHRLEVAAQNPQYSTQKIAQVLFEKWNHLSVEEKAVYKNMINKGYKKDIKKKERLGKIISQNLNEDVKDKTSSKTIKTELKPKKKTKNVASSLEQIKSFYLNKNRLKPLCQDINIINYLAPGIWVCAQKDKLYLLNTFRLQETIIYHRLLGTYQFDTERLETPQLLLNSDLGEDAMSILMQLSNSCIDVSGNICDERLTGNGFDIKFIRDENSEITFELVGITNCIAFYGIPDLKELLLMIKEKGISSTLSVCRPSKIVLYLQSEANRMSRSSPACQRQQDVEDLLNQRNKLPANCNMCIHHKTFFNEIWKLSTNA